MIRAICVVVDESKCLDIPNWEFSITSVHLPFWPGCKRILRLLLVLRIQVVLKIVHDLCGCHLWCWWSLLCKYCMRAGIIFHNVTSEYDSTFLLLKLRLQFRILEMTEVHWWRKMNFYTVVPCFSDHVFLDSDFCQLPCWYFLKFSHYFHCCLCIRYFECLRHWNKLVHQVTMLSEFIPFAAMWSSWYFCRTPSNRSLIDSSASKIQAYFVLRFPILRLVSPRQFTSVLQGIVAGIGMANFLQAFFIISLNSLSSGSME